MAERGYYLVHVQLGTPRTGLWCRSCQLPSGCEWPVVTLRPDGVGTLGKLRRCYDCGGAKVDDG